MRPTYQRRELAIRQNREIHRLARRGANPLILVERCDATSIVAHHHVCPGFFLSHAQLAIDRKRTREFALGNNVSESKAAAVVPGSVVDDLTSERLENARRNSNAITTENFVVVDCVFRDHFINMASRMNRRTNVACVNDLTLRDFIPHHVQPLGVVHDFFWNQQFPIDQTAELAKNFLDALPKFRRLQ